MGRITRASRPLRSNRIHKAEDEDASCSLEKCVDRVSAEGIQCDTCNGWFHIRCSGLTRATYELYNNHKGLIWDCRQCRLEMRRIALRKLDGDPNIPSNSEKVADDTKDTPIRKSAEGQNLFTGTPEEISDGKSTHPTNSERSGPDQTKLSREQLPGTPEKLGCYSSQETRAEEEKPRKKRAPRNRRKGSKGVEGAPESIQNTEENTDINSDLHKRMEAVEETNRKLTKALAQLEKNSDLALGRNRNVVVHGIAEPVMREGKQRERAMRYHIVNLLRMVNIPGHVAIKRVLRLGKWAGAQSTTRDPRPVLVEFANPRHRDSFLAQAERVRVITQGQVVIRPDDTARITTPSRSMLPHSPGFNTALLKPVQVIVPRYGTQSTDRQKAVTSKISGSTQSTTGCQRVAKKAPNSDPHRGNDEGVRGRLTKNGATARE